MEARGQSNSVWNDAEANKLPEKVQELAAKDELPQSPGRKRLVVVGLGMVGVAFM
jgi:nitrite reductase (NAD(P)H)